MLSKRLTEVDVSTILTILQCKLDVHAFKFNLIVALIKSSLSFRKGFHIMLFCDNLAVNLINLLECVCGVACVSYQCYVFKAFRLLVFQSNSYGIETGVL